jgi:hypothetical protein
MSRIVVLGLIQQFHCLTLNINQGNLCVLTHAEFRQNLPSTQDALPMQEFVQVLQMLFKGMRAPRGQRDGSLQPYSRLSRPAW